VRRKERPNERIVMGPSQFLKHLKD